MIPEIGLMIGFYIITRMVSFILRKGDRQESPAVMVLAAITILITVIVVIDLWRRGTQVLNLNF